MWSSGLGRYAGPATTAHKRRRDTARAGERHPALSEEKCFKGTDHTHRPNPAPGPLSPSKRVRAGAGVLSALSAPLISSMASHLEAPGVEDWRTTERHPLYSLPSHVEGLANKQVQLGLSHDSVERRATCPKANGPGWVFNGCLSSGWNRLQSFIIGGSSRAACAGGGAHVTPPRLAGSRHPCCRKPCLRDITIPTV